MIDLSECLNLVKCSHLFRIAYKWYMTCQFPFTLSLVQSYAPSDMVLLTSLILSPSLPPVLYHSIYYCWCSLFLPLHVIFFCCAVNTSWAIFDIFIRLCVSPKFLENENHISIIQRLVTETHSYSGRSRLTPVNPKIGNESCRCCCWCHCCWCESKRRVWKKICRTNMKQQILTHKNMENKPTHTYSRGDRWGRTGANAFQFGNIDKIWRIILTKC